MVILGVESTCDETGAGIVRDGRILANVVSSSSKLHEKYRGVVPEVAAREQVRVILPVIEEALSFAKLGIDGVDKLAVAYGPGLVGSLVIGVETVKTLALVLSKPLVPVNHLVAHIYSNWAGDSKPIFPTLGLIISGGHTDLILLSGHGRYKWLGGTRDDAVGEVFDKVARLLGLGYPGGPEIEKLANKWSASNNRSTIKFPRPMIGQNNLDFSFSGLKTSVVNYVNNKQLSDQLAADVAYQFQLSIADILVSKTRKAALKFGVKSLVVGGGVSANNFISQQFFAKFSDLAIPIYFPEPKLSVDNGAMVALAASYSGDTSHPLTLYADPSLHF